MSIVADISATVIPTGTWSIDPAHSAVEFQIKHMGLATVKGRAARLAGTIKGGEEPSIEGTVAIDSITTYDENRDGHLLSRSSSTSSAIRRFASSRPRSRSKATSSSSRVSSRSRA